MTLDLLPRMPHGSMSSHSFSNKHVTIHSLDPIHNRYIHDRDASVILRRQLADIYYILPHTKGGTRKMIVLLPKPTVRWTPTEDDDSMLASYNRGDTSKLDVLNRDTEDSGKYLFFFLFDNSNVQKIKSTNHKNHQVHCGHSNPVRKILHCYGTADNVSWHLVKWQRINFGS